MTELDDPGGRPADGAPTQLWSGDTGHLREPSRRALVTLLRGPYLSAERQPQLWSAVLADEVAVRSALADLYLELVLDTDSGVAFVRNVEDEEANAPRVVRTAQLTFMDTAMLLHLRAALVRAPSGERVIVGEGEVAEQLAVFRPATSTDAAGFAGRIRASWTKLSKYGLLQSTSTEGRWEISPVLRLVFGPEQVAAVRGEYGRILQEGERSVEPDDEAPEGPEGSDE